MPGRGDYRISITHPELQFPQGFRAYYGPDRNFQLDPSKVSSRLLPGDCIYSYDKEQHDFVVTQT